MIEISDRNNKISIKIGWKYLSYIQDKEKIIFSIEPMVEEADLIYIPNPESWEKSSPKWASKIREEILRNIKEVNWNRDIEFKECDISLKCMAANENEIEEGTIESTQAAREFLRLDLFDPDKKVEREQAHELWCTLEMRFAEQVEGKVTIYASDIIENSVFNKITIPTLLKNEKVVLNIIGR
jgi:hypothetical protein